MIFYSFIVSAPSLSLDLSEAPPLYAGSTLNLTCDITMPSEVDTDYHVIASWRSDGSPLPNTTRITDYGLKTMEDGSYYRSVLHFSSLSMIVDGNASYICLALVFPVPFSSVIIPSSPVEESVSINVQGKANSI